MAPLVNDPTSVSSSSCRFQRVPRSSVVAYKRSTPSPFQQATVAQQNHVAAASLTRLWRPDGWGAARAPRPLDQPPTARACPGSVELTTRLHTIRATTIDTCSFFLLLYGFRFIVSCSMSRADVTAGTISFAEGWHNKFRGGVVGGIGAPRFVVF